MLAFFRSLFVSIVLCFGVFASSAFAATALSEVSIAMDSNQPKPIDSLLTEALTTVLVRLTGDPDIVTQPAVAELLKDPQPFLETYKQQAEPARLDVAFDQSAIEQALQKAGVSYWASNRPTLMTWWLVDDEGSEILIGDSQPSADILHSAAAKQGFSIRLPLADLTEQSFADKATFDAEDPQLIKKASDQYTANALLIVHLKHTQDKFQGTWRLWLSNADSKPLEQGSVEAKTEQQLADDLFKAVNPALAKAFVLKAGEPKSLELEIKNVDFDRYVQVDKLMTTFNGRLIETAGSSIRYKVEADPMQLKAQLGLLHIYEDKAAESTPIDANKLNFTFQP